ncbi:MAG: methylcrotonyl-CoA carboxylase subunit alpha [Planctomycetota bacterium]
MPDRPPFRRVLIANRGEIAVRVARGLREMGIESVAVHSDCDRHSAHVLEADAAVALGGDSAADSYLRADKILEAARTSGAEAIHPGYGFLSENAAFARAVREAGLVFIGPSPEAMAALGDKRSAREVAASCGVPVVPGCEKDDGDEALIAKARDIGFPVMLKASAGGGGRGMRLVRREEDLVEALAAGRREAEAAFGDGSMIVEKALVPARHVEVQIAGDRHGNAFSLNERECSIQRRHQKVIEEAPSPVVDEELRARMGDAAERLARQVGYDNAGTVEFLVDERRRFYFLEVNARLQVEHPVTELVTGMDLVRLQILAASGADLSEILKGADLRPRGHALEARICAESPEEGFLPAAGVLRVVRGPEGPGIRFDSGIREGCEVPVHYDSLLAKLIVHGPDRDACCDRMARALRETVILGIPTNLDFLLRVVQDQDFRAGQLSTGFLAAKPDLAAGPGDRDLDPWLAAAALCQVLAPPRRSGGNGADPRRVAPVWTMMGGFRVWEDGE